MTPIASVADVMADLMGSTPDSGVTYVVYNQTITAAFVQSLIDDAIDYIYFIAGTDRLDKDFINSTDTRIKNIPKRAVIKIAAHRVLNRMMGNIMTEDYSVSVDGLQINKSNFPQIVVEMIKNLYEEAHALIQMLQEPALVSNQQHTSMAKSGITLRKDSSGTFGRPIPDPYE